MDFILEDLKRYHKALARAKASSWTEYVEPLERIVSEMENIIKIDADFNPILLGVENGDE